jgi:hypothetical protein
MYIGKFIGLETITNEYKEIYILKFNINGKKISLKNLLFNYNINNKFFNDLILKTIKSYIINYLPKYISAFNNSKLNGKLYIGVNDYGFIEGIPFYGELKIDDIYQFLFKINKYIRMYNLSLIDQQYELINYNMINYIKNMKVDIIKLEYNDNLNELKNEYISKLNYIIEQNEKLKEMWIIYIKEHKKWVHDVYYYGSSIFNYIHDKYLRLCVNNYIIKNRINYHNSDEIFDKLNDIFLNNKNIEYDFTHEEIQELKEDITSPIKWILEYKDYMALKLKKIRPKHPGKKPNKYILKNFCNNISNIRYPLLKNNFNYYMIIINIQHIPDKIVEYKKIKSDVWYNKERKLNKYNEPCCI